MDQGKKLKSKTAWRVFCIVSVLIFAVNIAVSVIITSILPKTYASMARVIARPSPQISTGTNESATDTGADPIFIATAVEVMRSDLILDKVITSLDLNKAWAQKFNSPDGPLKIPETHQILKHMIEIRPEQNSRVVDIRVYSDSAEEAAKIANSIAESYQDYREEQDRQLRKANPQSDKDDLIIEDPIPLIVDMAEPSSRPVRPNILLNIALGGLAGIISGAIAGSIAAAIVIVLRRTRT